MKANQQTISELEVKVLDLSTRSEQREKHIKDNWVQGGDNSNLIHNSRSILSYDEIDILKSLKQVLEFEQNLKVGNDVTVQLYSDAQAYRIISIAKSGKSFTAQRLEAERKEGSNPEFIPGGFAGHCVNNRAIEYTYSEDEKNPIIKISRRKNGTWKKSGCNSTVYVGAHEIYDYNF